MFPVLLTLSLCTKTQSQTKTRTKQLLSVKERENKLLTPFPSNENEIVD